MQQKKNKLDPQNGGYEKNFQCFYLVSSLLLGAKNNAVEDIVDGRNNRFI